MLVLLLLLKRLPRGRPLEALLVRLLPAGPLGGAGHLVPGTPLLKEEAEWDPPPLPVVQKLHELLDVVPPPFVQVLYLAAGSLLVLLALRLLVRVQL